MKRIISSLLSVLLVAAVLIPLSGCKEAAYKDGVTYANVSGHGVVKTADKSIENATIVEKFNREPVTTIEDEAFSGCGNLRKVTLPDSITTIGEKAFADCASLKSIELPAGVTKIGEEAFSGCSSLKSIVIPDGVTEIEEGAFYGCGNLTEVTIPSSVTSIAPNAFGLCIRLNEIEIPSSVTTISDNAFKDCRALDSVTLNDGLVDLGDAFQGCVTLRRLTLPSTVKYSDWMDFTSIKLNMDNVSFRIVSILDAIKYKLVSEKIRVEAINYATITLTNISEYNLYIYVEYGTYLVSNGRNYSNMLLWNYDTTKKHFLAPGASEEYDYNTACMSLHRYVPETNTKMYMALGSRPFRNLVPLLAGQKYEVAQAAVWIISDKATLDSCGVLIDGQGNKLIDAVTYKKAQELANQAYGN